MKMLDRCLLVLMCWLSVCCCASVKAATLSVTSALDDGSGGTLRSQITAAATGDVITFAPSVFVQPRTITLTQGEIPINKNLTIFGPGAARCTISGNNASRIFNISGNSVRISGMTLSNGRVIGEVGASGSIRPQSPEYPNGVNIPAKPGGAAQGGAIFNSGTLTLTDVVLSNNQVTGGAGGIVVGSVRGSTPAGAVGGAGQGGAIFNSGTLSLNNTAFNSNNATGGVGGPGSTYTTANGAGAGGTGAPGGIAQGGGLYNGGTFTVVSAAWNNNSVTGGPGGAGGTGSPSGSVGPVGIAQGPNVFDATLNSAPRSGTGLLATYYDNRDFTGSRVERTDAVISFLWGEEAPVNFIERDTFSVRWTGILEPQFSQTYTFYARADDGIRVWIDGQQIIDGWKDQGPTEYSGSIELVAGARYEIVVEYYDNLFGAVAQLRWSSPSTAKNIIPRERLYPTYVPTPTPTPTAPDSGNGTGLAATYYDNNNFTGTTVTRVDPTLDFNWGDGSPAAAIARDTFSARWTGQVQAQKTETYTFYARADDGIQVWIDGRQIIDGWKDQGPTEYSGSIELVAGTKYEIVVSYYENLFGAVAQLLWSSPSTPKAIVPRSQLYPATVAPLTPTPTPTETTPPTEVGTGTGLSATYYDGRDFTGTTVTRVNPAIDFDWGNGSPSTAIGNDSFSARWTGQVQAQKTETYTFTTRSDDGVRLWVNGQKLIDNWTIHGPTNDSASIELTAGVKYDIRLEYFEEAFGAELRLLWSSPSTPEAIIPQSQLYPLTTDAANQNAPALQTIVNPLSTGTASAGRALVRLVFAVPLDAPLAADRARYRVEIDGVRTTVEAASYVASSRTLSLSLPEDALSKGAHVKVLWYNLRQTSGASIANGFWQGTAG
jgi:hypothetical protein